MLWAVCCLAQHGCYNPKPHRPNKCPHGQMIISSRLYGTGHLDLWVWSTNLSNSFQDPRQKPAQFTKHFGLYIFISNSFWSDKVWMGLVTCCLLLQTVYLFFRMGVSLGRRSLMGGVILVIPITFTIACRQKSMSIYAHVHCSNTQGNILFIIREVYLQSPENATQYFRILFTEIFI